VRNEHKVFLTRSAAPTRPALVFMDTRFSPRNGAAMLSARADVAELVDAHGSGPCALRGVEVQVLSSALVLRFLDQLWRRVVLALTAKRD
jgi:hypothetical protein